MTAKFALTVAVTYDPDLIDRLVQWAKDAAGALPLPTESTAVVTTRDKLRALADQLEAVRREVERMRATNDDWAATAKANLDEADLMRPVVEAADRYVYRGGAVLPLKEAIDAYRAAKAKP